MKREIISGIFLAALFFCAAAGADLRRDGWIDFNKNGVKDVYEDPSADVRTRVADLLLV